MPAYQQFTPGRIDHHNVQIALALLVAAATVWSDRKRWTAAAAGALTGLAFAIGFESAPYLAICGGMLALRYVADADADRALRDYGLALAASTALALLVSVGPDRWALNRCDAIAFNNAAAAISAGAVLALAAWLKHADGVTRLFAVAGAGCLAAAVLVLFEPRCARGPFAMVDPAIWPVWHDHVRAMQPLHAMFKVNPLTAAAAAAFPALALLAMAKLMTERKLRHDFGFLTASFVFLAAAAAMIAAVRGYSYAMWLGMPLVAGLTQRLFVAWQIERFIPRLATGLLFTPVAISAGAVTIAHANGLSDTDSFARPASRDCLANASYAALARLAPGLVIADVGYGPYLLALTPHSVMGAPYHRLSTGIAVSRGVFASPPDDARAIVNAARLVGSGGQPTYLMICGPKAPDGLAEPGRGRSLWARLQARSAPSWLEPVGEKGPLAVWRVKL